MPDEESQQRTTVLAGDAAMQAAFPIYQCAMGLYLERLGRTSSDSRVLDFGCGWGRFTRFFLRDFEPRNIWGVDVDEVAIQACQTTNLWSNFALVDRHAPSQLSDETFDLVFSQSVFSHLPEEMALGWIREFRRILRPGGLMIATTLPRAFMEQCEEMRRDDALTSRPHWRRGAAGAFDPLERYLATYDAGRYCFNTVEGAPETYGLACIPERYAQQQWAKYLDLDTYVRGVAAADPDVIVMRKISDDAARPGL